MSLRAFHVLFITLSIVLALCCGGIALRDYFETGSFSRLSLSILALLVAIGLAIYEIYFLRKTRKLIL
jgi:hypothetical protein